jgi:hypothetical protein
MDLHVTTETRFRDELRSWLTDNGPKEWEERTAVAEPRSWGRADPEVHGRPSDNKEPLI